MSREPSPSSPQLNATVMASAGTGKTWLLVSRLVRLLLHGARADAILAITFTRKAAAEMQTRLSERLYQLASADDEELAELLRELSVPPTEETLICARGLYEELLKRGQSVRTTTFHSFCQDILRRFPLEADVPPGFELLESSGELTRTAWDLLLEQVTLSPDSDTAKDLEKLLSYCGSLHGLQQALFTFLNHRGDWWAHTEREKTPLQYAIEQLRQQLEVDENLSPLEQLFRPEREQALIDYCELLNKHPIKSNFTRLEQLSSARDASLTLEQRFAHCREALLTKQGQPRACKPSKAQATKMGDEGQNRFIDLHQQLSGALLRALDQLAAIETLKASTAWYRVGSQLLSHFQRLKAERRQLDFTDLEWRAYRLLHHEENAQWVQYKLDQRIEHLLVDEFQDTNPTQWRLLQPLLQEMAAGASERHRSVFLVGDAKQSIYRFRRAEPRLFQAAHDWLQGNLGAQGFPLHISWRSSPAIMQGVNKLFGDNGSMQGILRDFTPHDTHLQGLWGKVCALPLVDEQADESDALEALPLRNPLHQPRIIQGDLRYQQEGELIAAEINRLVTEQAPIGQGDSARPIHYGDVMILVRSRAHVGDYESALRAAGIPYIGAERGTLLESLEVRDMVALLEWLITPYGNLSLATVLRSPLFDCSDESLMALAAMESQQGNWYQRLCTLAKHSESHPLHRAWQLLSRWQQLAGILPIHDLLDRIYNEGNVLARYRAAYPEYLQPRSESNLTRFLELALTIDSGRYPSLGRFLARLSEMRANSDEAPDEAPTKGGSQRVRIMTIHASKGLEAPVVFLADSARGVGKDRPFRALIDWPAKSARPSAFLLVGKKGQQDAFTREALERAQKEELREDANLLYVALTRARQLLYLTACAPRRGDELGWYGAIRQALDPLGEKPLNESVELERGTPPPLTEKQRTTQESPKVPLPQALLHPFTLPAQEREIAPSYKRRNSHHETMNVSDEDAQQRGIIIHRLLELMTGTVNYTLEQATHQVAAEQGLSSKDDALQQWADEVRQLLACEHLQSSLKPQTGESLNEVPIIYQLQGSTVHGIIDRLLIMEDEVWVIDYKTHRGAREETHAEMAESYHTQLHYYRKGITRLWPQKQVRTFLLFTSSQALYEVNPST